MLKNLVRSIITSKSISDRLLPTYLVLDLETTDKMIKSSEIVQIGALKIQNGKIAEKFVTYVKPYTSISEEASKVNHITNEMVASAPPLDVAFESFMNFAEGIEVWTGYNLAGFDLPLLNNQISKHLGKTLTVSYIDVYQQAKKNVAGLKDYKLTTLAKSLNISGEGAHDALNDCIITFKVFEALISLHQITLEPSIIEKFEGKPFYSGIKVKNSDSTNAINELRELVSDITEDGKVTQQEFTELEAWISQYESLKGNFPYDEVHSAVRKILEDGKVENEELLELQQMLEVWLDPINKSTHNRIQTIQDKHIVLTGDFKFGSKSDVEAYIIEHGGIIDNNVKKATDYCLVGGNGSDAWANGDYGTKIKKAIEYSRKGCQIEIIREKDFFKEVK